MSVMMHFTFPPSNKPEQGYTVTIGGPDAKKIARERDYIDTGPPADWVGRGGELDLALYHKKTFPDRESASDELVYLASIGVQADDDTEAELKRAKERKEP